MLRAAGDRSPQCRQQHRAARNAQTRTAERPIYPLANQAVVEEIGTVKWCNAVRGFGFVGSRSGGKDIFVHATVLNRAGIADLAEGQRVAVDVVDGRKVRKAAKLTPDLKTAPISSPQRYPRRNVHLMFYDGKADRASPMRDLLIRSDRAAVRGLRVVKRAAVQRAAVSRAVFLPLPAYRAHWPFVAGG